MPYQANGPLGFPSLDPKLDLLSPPLSCTQGGTIWSQPGNSYSQIVDLSDVDNSRSVLPPGISEEPGTRFYTNLIPLWVKGTLHPAPLSRPKIEALAVAKSILSPALFEGPDALPEKLAASTNTPGLRFFPAIPQPLAPNAIREASGALRGRKPDDARLEAALRYLIRPERTASELEDKIKETKLYLAGHSELNPQMIGGLQLILSLRYGTDAAQIKMRSFLDELERSAKQKP